MSDAHADVDDDLELRLLLEAIYGRYHYDFRSYAVASLRRRLAQALVQLEVKTYSGLQEKILHDHAAFPRLLQYLTVPVSEMFRDPDYYLALRRQVLPRLRTYPSLKIWIAGCSTGEEVYSFAILLAEEGLLDRSLIYATDINTESLRKAKAGVYEVDRIRQFTENHQRAGGHGSLSEHYTAAHGGALFDKTLRKNVVFSDHSLATDSVFAEVQLVSCRNVLIYFNKELQERALGLFKDALSHMGFLGLGSKESLHFSRHAPAFTELDAEARIYQRSA